MPRHSDIPRRIISFLSQNPAATRKELLQELQQELKVSRQAIQKHIKELQASREVRELLVVDEAAVEKRKYQYWIFILTKSANWQFPWWDLPSRSSQVGESQNSVRQGTNTQGVTVAASQDSHIEQDNPYNDYQDKLCDDIKTSLNSDSNLVKGLVFVGINILIGGDYDIILRLYTDDHDSVGRYVTRLLRNHPAVQATRTAWSFTNQPSSDRVKEIQKAKARKRQKATQ